MNKWTNDSEDVINLERLFGQEKALDVSYVEAVDAEIGQYVLVIANLLPLSAREEAREEIRQPIHTCGRAC